MFIFIFFGDLSIHLEFEITLSSIVFWVLELSRGSLSFGMRSYLTRECVVTQNTLANLV